MFINYQQTSFINLVEVFYLALLALKTISIKLIANTRDTITEKTDITIN
jgi:hypothetical protein